MFADSAVAVRTITVERRVHGFSADLAVSHQDVAQQRRCTLPGRVGRAAQGAEGCGDLTLARNPLKRPEACLGLDGFPLGDAQRPRHGQYGSAVGSYPDRRRP